MELQRGNLRRALSNGLNDPTQGWIFKGEDPKAVAIADSIEKMIDAKIDHALKQLRLQLPED